MRIRRLSAVARKEGIHVLRDPRSLALAIAMPVLMLVLFGWALKLDVDNIRLVVWDQSNTSESREFLSRFDASRYFTVAGHAENYRDIEGAIDNREALVALIIPGNFAAKVAAGRPVKVQAIIDGSDPNTAAVAMGYAEVITVTYSQQVGVAQIRRLGRKPPDPLLGMRPRVWFNTDLESTNFIIPGLIAIIMMIIAALLTSLTVSREWERGTMEQLISTPVRRSELILGKVVPYLVIGIVDVLIAFLMGEFVFHVPFRGNAALLFVASVIFLVGALSMGLTVSILTKNQLLSTQLAMVLTFLPAFLLSGFIFPITNMPRVIQAATYLVPARYFIGVLRAIYLKGLGLGTLGLELLFLLLFSAVMLLAATAGFSKRLE